jgi:pyruvate-formate lyase-activating enzyme
MIKRRDTARVERCPGPWRITFDTNPDTCNLHCVMCEEHSPHSPLQIRRKEAGQPRRVMPIELDPPCHRRRAPHGLREVIPSTMGEPLLYDHFERSSRSAASYGVKLNLTTNGTFLASAPEAWAERIVPVTSDVKISWNGATAPTHEAVMLGARWENRPRERAPSSRCVMPTRPAAAIAVASLSSSPSSKRTSPSSPTSSG